MARYLVIPASPFWGVLPDRETSYSKLKSYEYGGGTHIYGARVHWYLFLKSVPERLIIEGGGCQVMPRGR